MDERFTTLPVFRGRFLAVAPERNLKGISFAVANVTGLIARELWQRW